MVQILKNRKPESFLESILTGYEKGREDYIKAYPTIAEEKRLKEQAKAEEDLAQRLGLNLKGVSPEMRRLYIAEHLKGEREMQELKAKQEEDREKERELRDQFFGRESGPQAPAYSSREQPNENAPQSFGAQITRGGGQQPSFANKLLQEPTAINQHAEGMTSPPEQSTSQPAPKKYTDAQKQYLALHPKGANALKLIE